MNSKQKPQERKKFILNKMQQRRSNTKEAHQFVKMNELNIVIHDKAYEWFKATRCSNG